MKTQICQLHSISGFLAKRMPQWSWPGNSPSRSSCWKASSRPAGRFSLLPLPQHQNAALLLSCCPHPWTPQTIYVYFQGPVLDLRVAAGMLFFLHSLDMLIHSRISPLKWRVACWLMPWHYLAGTQGPLGPPLGLVLEVMKISKKVVIVLYMLWYFRFFAKSCVPQNTAFGPFCGGVYMGLFHLSWKFLILYRWPPAPAAPPAMPSGRGHFMAFVLLPYFVHLFFARSAKRSKMSVKPCFYQENQWKQCIFNAFHWKFKISMKYQWKCMLSLDIFSKNTILNRFSYEFQDLHEI